MPAPQGYSTRTLRDCVGHGFGASVPITLDQERINTFADVSGDHKAGVIPTDVKGAINYALDRIRFTAPMPAGKRAMALFKLAEADDKGPKGQRVRLAAALDVGGSDKPALVSDVLVLVMD
jgi:acyl dehydratase